MLNSPFLFHSMKKSQSKKAASGRDARGTTLIPDCSGTLAVNAGDVQFWLMRSVEREKENPWQNAKDGFSAVPP
jgi:hypothetical protein